jgi:hypothetical protein
LANLECTAEACRSQAEEVRQEAHKRAERLKWLGGRSQSAAAADAKQVSANPRVGKGRVEGQ